MEYNWCFSHIVVEIKLVWALNVLDLVPFIPCSVAFWVELAKPVSPPVALFLLLCSGFVTLWAIAFLWTATGLCAAPPKRAFTARLGTQVSRTSSEDFTVHFNLKVKTPCALYKDTVDGCISQLWRDTLASGPGFLFLLLNSSTSSSHLYNIL